MKRNRRKVFRPFLESLEDRVVPAAVLSTSTNWSGYAVQANAGTVTRVAGSWTVPTVATCQRLQRGLGRHRRLHVVDTVEQIGTDQRRQRRNATYYAWYEMYPSDSVNIAPTAQDQDRLTAARAT